MVMLSREEARELERAWGIDEDELVITFVARQKPAPPTEAGTDDGHEECDGQRSDS
jgi:hypothetical protein